MDDAIRRALAAAAPERSVERVAATDGSANPGNRTVRVRFADGETAYLKVAVDGNRTRLARAGAVARFAGERTAIRVPDVLASDPDDDPPYLLTAPLSGTPVDAAWARGSIDERADLSRAAGRTLATLHGTRFGESGRVVGGDGVGLDVDPATWPAVVEGLVDDESAFESERFADFPGRAREVVASRREALALGRDGAESADDDDRPVPALLHNDPRPENAFCGTGDGCVGLIDWEQAMVGDPVLDIVKAEGRFLGRPDIPGRERLREALFEGYRERAGELPAGFDLRRGVYRVVTFLGVAEGFDEWAPGVDEPTEELAGWVRETFEERVEDV